MCSVEEKKAIDQIIDSGPRPAGEMDFTVLHGLLLLLLCVVLCSLRYQVLYFYQSHNRSCCESALRAELCMVRDLRVAFNLQARVHGQCESQSMANTVIRLPPVSLFAK